MPRRAMARAGRGAGVAALALLLVACSAPGHLTRAEAEALERQLPGDYDNASQVAQELAAGAPAAHEPLVLSIRAIPALVLGDRVYYVHETAAGDVRRVLAARVWILSTASNGEVLLGVFPFADPERWRRAPAEPELFRALQPSDLNVAASCTLRWQRSGDGVLQATSDPSRCRLLSATAPVQMQQQIRLSAQGLELLERWIGADGSLVRGRALDAGYRFDRHGS